ncbi:hypothetical protein HLB23_34605 [Nocardia uniformis]|uniref:Uncharacterized protein n=1 Tax=Nocardia uniformis TaxID=53432 RepID=A0A849C814_9NOCA|nr:hypothetical protein [Nocardia uniformis]NNH74923.1 hypothetical protein [Nocardia uniformis]
MSPLPDGGGGPRSTARVAWTECDRGGHFAAMEAPDLLLADSRDSYRTRRQPAVGSATAQMSRPGRWEHDG